MECDFGDQCEKGSWQTEKKIVDKYAWEWRSTNEHCFDDGTALGTSDSAERLQIELHIFFHEAGRVGLSGGLEKLPALDKRGSRPTKILYHEGSRTLFVAWVDKSKVTRDIIKGYVSQE